LNILITGAAGFVGRQLVRRVLFEYPNATSITCVDLNCSALPSSPNLRIVNGSLVEAAVFADVFNCPMDLVFHMATIPGGWAEENFELGTRVNLMLTYRILEALRCQHSAPRFIFTSSIGVFGHLDGPVDDDTVPRPTWSYGTHKAIGELLTADYTRKGFIDGRVIRLPGLVARPPDPSGAISAFLSDLIRVLGAGQDFVCPVSAASTCWWMSRHRAVENILHAAAVSTDVFPPQRVYTLPALHCSIASVVDAIGMVTGQNTRDLVIYRPNSEVEERFGKLPPLNVPRAESCGFRSDGTIEAMVRCALQGLSDGQ